MDKEKEKEQPRFTAEDKKGYALIAVLALIALVLFIFASNAFNDNDTVGAGTESTAATTTAATTTATTTSMPTTLPPQTTTDPALQSTVQNTTVQAPSAEATKAEILKAITDGINSLKASDASFTGVKTQDIHVELTTCSVPSLTGLINRVIGVFTGEETYTYEFNGGVADDPEENATISSNKAIPPTEKPFSLTEAGIASAKCEKDGENTVYTIVVVAEKSTLSDPRPPHHNAAGDTLDLGGLDLPVGEITKADFDYPGATVSITLDKNGKVIRYHERLEMSGVGEGNALGITGSGEMTGYIDETWDIQWK